MLGVVLLILKIIGILLLILLALVVLVLTVPLGVRGEIAHRHPALYAKVGPVEVKVYPFPEKKEKKKKAPSKQKKTDSHPTGKTPPETGGAPKMKREKPSEYGEKQDQLPAALDLPKTTRESVMESPKTGDKKQTEFHSRLDGEMEREKKQGKKPAGEKEASVGEIPWELIRRLLGMAGPVIRKVLAALRIYDLELVLPVQGQDAADTAITYGRVAALVYGTLTLLANLCPVEAKRIWLEPDFTGEQRETEYFSCKITTHLFIIVVIILWVLFRLKWPKDE